MQRTDGLPGADRFVGGFGRLPRLGLVNMDEGLQLGFQRRDARQTGIHQIDGGKLTSCQSGRQSMDRQCGKIGTHAYITNGRAFCLTTP